VTKTSASARVAQSIREDIASGRRNVGDQLPTRRELVEQYGIAAMTAARVVRILAEEGLVVSDVGRGVFIAAVPGAVPASIAKGDALEQLEARVRAIEERLDAFSRPQ
jgi:DNA-binding GntR family transcriptional regulator